MEAKFGRRLQDADVPRRTFGIDFAVESYLRHQGESFLRRFDANTYLHYTRVMDYFDPFGEPDAAARLREVRTRFLLVSFSSDWRFGTPHTRFIAEQLEAVGVDVTAHEVDSPYGHDSFLFALPEYHRLVSDFLADVLTVGRGAPAPAA
jgi:homoserine O-acetyltransferase/O-succinyltransferase